MGIKGKLLMLGAVFSAFSTVIAYGQSSSSNYAIDEYFVGPGGATDLSSASYEARATLGDLGTGNPQSASYQAYAGYTTTSDPFVELTVNGTIIDMGVLDSSTTGTGTATFTIRTWLAEGYNIYASGTVPTSDGGATIDGMSAAAASSQGTEQFGLNLVANTSPVAFGANRTLDFPGFSFGEPTNDYDDDGMFKFLPGDPIATASESTSDVTFTVSYIMNVGDFTDAGTYQTNQSFIITSTF